MDNIDKYKEIVDSITSEDVVKFFETVPGGGSCPICSDNLVAFTSMTRREDGSVFQNSAKPALVSKVVLEASLEGESFSLPSFTACCDSCGFMADFSVVPLVEHIARQRHDDF
ncbi:hypothetical protein KUW18_10015 [Halomonas sp. DP5Y7-2]|uniref:hypothetical protein n=1 Tax=Halomonas sp. DP5Y7-2 TaxID=2859076 RepID=UPI001C993DFB|nr:hypothetical protein [Halomonas sp. DP5Y7-2]MBY5984424.1 hypothetical protein [Halomonas sp. DP5Y7-2]